MSIRNFKVSISGPAMLHHNSRLADPLDPYTQALKEITSKRTKSDDDYLEMGRREFQGGLNFEDDTGPCIYSHMIEACIIAGATKNRLGKEFKATMTVPGDYYKLEYEGPRTRETLWADERFRDRRSIVVARSRVQRTRPKFRNWKLSFEVSLFAGGANARQLEEAIEKAGFYAGLGDYRPKFGRFAIDSFQNT